MIDNHLYSLTSFTEGIAFFNRQAFFECHEILEECWRPLPMGAEKLFLQGLIQLAVGFHHYQKGNRVGTKNLLTSGLEKLSQAAIPDYAACYDWPNLRSQTQAILERLSNDTVSSALFPKIAP